MSRRYWYKLATSIADPLIATNYVRIRPFSGCLPGPTVCAIYALPGDVLGVLPEQGQFAYDVQETYNMYNYIMAATSGSYAPQPSIGKIYVYSKEV